jgi:hypothetical protein
MNTINQNSAQVFSFHRFVALLKTYITEQSKTLMLYTASLIGIFILVGAFIGYHFGSSWRQINDTAASTNMMLMFTYTVFSFCMSFSASLMFSTLQNRASRISTFMLPASILEKYLVRLVVYLFAFVVCFAVAVMLGESTRLIFSYEGTESIFKMFNLYSFEIWNHAIASTLAGHALYTLGSSLWPKRSFLKTFIASIILGIIVISLFPNKLEMHIVDVNNWVLWILMYVWALLLYFLAWLRFRSTQIVQCFMMD